jgi:orotidine-5'-phosphate decarboxylase
VRLRWQHLIEQSCRLAGGHRQHTESEIDDVDGTTVVDVPPVPDIGPPQDVHCPQLGWACWRCHGTLHSETAMHKNGSVIDTFASRFEEVRSERGPLAWGLDPSGTILDSWGFGDTPDGLDRFADTGLRAAVGSVGLVKLQSAFYERHGWRGFRTLQRLIAEARGAGLLVIVDAKRGDVGTTNDAYAETFLGANAPLAADALTVHPYLGLAAMGSFVTRAHQAGSCLLVVTRSSNPEGRQVQSALDQSGRSVEATLLHEIGELNQRLAPGQIGPIGAVVGPTHMHPALDLPAAHGLFLAPGVGAQGATPHDVARAFATCPERVIPSASRSLLVPGPDLTRLRENARTLASELHEALTQ